MSEGGVRERHTPARRLRWYDLITPQALGLGVPALLLAGSMSVWAATGLFENTLGQVQVWLIRFTGLNLFLDFSNLLILGMALWIMSRVTDPMLPARFVSLSRKSALIGVGAGLGAVVVSSVIEYLSDRYLHTNLAQDSSTTMVLPHSIDQLALGVFTVAVMAPLTEEVYFRGIVLGWMRRHWGMAWAIGLSSLVFGAMHLKWLMPGGTSGMVSTVELVAMGVLLALVAVRTGSLWTSVITHAVNNLCAALAAVFLAQ
ncbi:MAG: CPBP family intramembrane metalloprotease [Alphaproteobacteria bacterium]|nr:CPBP family intramembrane metalloprotease [Alphaproteobacteria bacterium]